MNKLSILILFAAAVNCIFPQQSHSIQFSGGIIMPMSSSKGLTTTVQFNYRFGNDISFYLYSGYSYWDRFNVNFQEDLSGVQKESLFSTYIADNHILIPVYIGSRINFNSNELFTAFVTFEVGYSYLSYNSYNYIKEINIESGEVLAYKGDPNTKKEITEHLLGIGAGAGLSHNLNETMDIILFFKLNSNLNSEYYDFLSSQGTYTSVSLGLNVNI